MNTLTECIELAYYQDGSHWESLWYYKEENVIRHHIFISQDNKQVKIIKPLEEQNRLRYYIDRQGARVEV
jgi:hypothetical protein